jgi:C-terminal processing protease CtpA/Prc
MITRSAALALGCMIFGGCGSPNTAHAQEFRNAFSFASAAAGKPVGWSGGPRATLSADSVVYRSAPYAGRLSRDAASEGQFSALTISVPVTFTGSVIEVRGWLRTASAMGGASLWLRQDNESDMLVLDNMHDRLVTGTTEWQQLTIRMALRPAATKLVLGALLRGTGDAWVDDVEVLVDGKPFTAAPPRVIQRPAFASDTVFDGGSKIADATLSKQQVENLALLAKVWGFTKYHHPAVTSGKLNWDYELFRIYPAVAAATERKAATDVIALWLTKVGDPPACTVCAQLPANVALSPNISWIHDANLLGHALKSQLENIYRNRSMQDRQQYVSRTQNVRNPVFETESSYARMTNPDAGYRILALFRFWNIIEYWFPYREGMAQPWDDVLRSSLPAFAAPMTPDEYKLGLIRLSVPILDTHSNLWRALSVRPPRGDAQLTALVRFIGSKAVVWGVAPSKVPGTDLLQRGDIIEKIGGASVDSLVAAWRPYYSASNEPTRLRDIGRNLTRGAAGPVNVRIIRDGKRMEVKATRVPVAQLDMARANVHDLPGETFQMLRSDVAYLKLSSVKAADIGSYLERATNAEVLVIDIRNYPAEFMPFALGGHLVDKPTQFAKFTRGDLSNPGAFTWQEGNAIQPLSPRFAGKVVVLVDEVSQSQAEYTAMAFRAAGAMIVGSTTAGADGNVSTIPLPGGVSNMISGIGVYYPDGRPTQRIGIKPDLLVVPTVQGIRAGRDEVLEAAVSKALGRAFSLSQPIL